MWRCYLNLCWYYLGEKCNFWNFWGGIPHPAVRWFLVMQRGPPLRLADDIHDWSFWRLPKKCVFGNALPGNEILGLPRQRVSNEVLPWATNTSWQTCIVFVEWRRNPICWQEKYLSSSVQQKHPGPVSAHFARLLSAFSRKLLRITNLRDPATPHCVTKAAAGSRCCHYRPDRGEICHCLHCRRQCKIFASGVNFSIFTH